MLKEAEKSDFHNLVLLSERSERKGPRAPEAKLGKRNSGSETREAKLGKRNSGSETRVPNRNSEFRKTNLSKSEG
jgi:hypothetical protein